MDLAAAAARNRPETGDYLLAPRSAKHPAVYVIAATDGYMVRAVGAAKGQGVVLLENSWPSLAAAGFRIRSYEELQDGRLRTLVILGTLVLMSVLVFVTSQPLGFVQAVSMTAALGFAFLAVVVVKSFKRDFFLTRACRIQSSQRPPPPG